MKLSLQRTASILICVLLLCQCATKHQPKVYYSYFQEGYTTQKERAQHLERLELEEKAATLNLFQKKRLYDLYQVELGRVRESSELRRNLEQKSDLLYVEVAQLVETSELKNLKISESTPTAPLKPKWEKKLKTARDHWNRDENEKALKLIEEVLSSEEFSKDAGNEENYRVQLLKFRILQENFESPSLIVSYQNLKTIFPCKPETTQAGFVLALRAYVNGKKDDARAIFESQCDEDKSFSNLLRRNYWLYQFQTDAVKKEAAYTSLLNQPVYGYYLYLAKAARGEDSLLSIPTTAPRTPESFSVSSKVHSLLLDAELRMDNNLRKDATPFLVKAAEELKSSPDENIDALIYVMDLFQAGGNHLEAVKLFGNLQSAFQKPESFLKLNQKIQNVFPKPFAPVVENASQQWEVPKEFVWSIMRQESAFNAFATSSSDARGLMQIMPFLAKEMGQAWKYRVNQKDKVMYSAEENIKLGAFHLHQLFRYVQHPALVAASYNAGIQRVGRWTKRMGNLPLDVFVELIPIPETRNYVKLVLRNYIYYHAMANQGIVGKDFIALKLPEKNPLP